MKQKNAAVLALILIVTLLGTSCGRSPQKAEPTEALQNAEIHLLKDLAYYIYYSEKVYASAQWALENCKRVEEEKTSDALQIARASVCAARERIGAYEFPQAQLTDADYTVLLDAGIDIGFMKDAAYGFEADRSSWMQSLDFFETRMMDHVYLRGSLERTMQLADLYLEESETKLQCLANTADWTISTIRNAISDDKGIDGFCDTLQEVCPLTAARQTKEPTTPEEIEKSQMENEDRLEALVAAFSKILSAESDELHRMEEAGASYYSTLTKEDLVSFAGASYDLIRPDWYAAGSVSYHWKTADGDYQAYAPGDEIGEAPNTILLKVENVAMSDVKAYYDLLVRMGIPAVGESTEAGKYFGYFEYGGAQISLRWKDGSVVLMISGGGISLVPAWYPIVRDTVNA